MYITLAEANNYLGTSWEDTLIDSIILSAESILNNLLKVATITQATYTENIKFPAYTGAGYTSYGKSFYLSNINPTSITSIDGISVWVLNTDYTIAGRKITLKLPMQTNPVFPFTNTVIYTAWFATAPNDIKHAMYILTSWLYNTRKTEWIKRFKQSLLEIEYKDTNWLDTILDNSNKWVLQAIVNKYKVITVLTTWIDRNIINWIYPVW